MKREEKIQKVIYTAKKYLGTPYKRTARHYQAPDVFNCSTFTRFIFEKVGKNLPKKAITQAAKGRKVYPKNIKTGDLVFIRGTRGYYNKEFPNGVGHVGICVGDDKVISARGRDKQVVEEKLKNYLKKDQFRTIRRFI
ncbi:C40 family peptidase [Patescibacteria group bacterium]|nr:C40 family peptidase [Patescibacteria group bacterium]